MINLAIFERNLGPGGPIKHVRNILKYIDRKKFHPYLITSNPNSLFAEEVLRYIDGNDVLVIPDTNMDWNPGTNRFDDAPEDSPLYSWLEEKKIDVLLAERNGESQFPLNSPKIRCRKADINIFGGVDTSPDLSRSFCISQGVLNVWSEKIRSLGGNPDIGRINYLSTDFPASSLDLRKDYGIDDDTIVFGRLSNKWVADHANLEAYAKVESDKTMFLCPATTPHHRKIVEDLGITRILFFSTIADMNILSRLINTMDVMAHHRIESFGCSVSEAIMHGKPVVSLKVGPRDKLTEQNAHEELIQDTRYIPESIDEYAELMQEFINKGRDYCAEIGKQFYDRIVDTHSAPVVIKQLEDYIEEMMQ